MKKKEGGTPPKKINIPNNIYVHATNTQLTRTHTYYI